MQIQNNQNQNLLYQNTNQNKKLEEENSYSNFIVDTKTAKEDVVFLTKDLISFIDKQGGFSSLTKEDEALFRAILEDDKISTSEVKNLSYE